MRARVSLLVLLHIDSHVCVCLCVCVHNGKLERNWCVECPLTLLPEAAASWCRDTACAVSLVGVWFQHTRILKRREFKSIEKTASLGHNAFPFASLSIQLSCTQVFFLPSALVIAQREREREGIRERNMTANTSRSRSRSRSRPTSCCRLWSPPQPGGAG
jgi:hypothetical protein